jgi:hypothetical protein
MPVVSPLHVTRENSEENDADLCQDSEEPDGDRMPEIDNPTITDPKVDPLQLQAQDPVQITLMPPIPRVIPPHPPRH